MDYADDMQAPCEHSQRVAETVAMTPTSATVLSAVSTCFVAGQLIIIDALTISGSRDVAPICVR